MLSNNAIITINLVKAKQSHDLEIPPDISASELCSALYAIQPVDNGFILSFGAD